METYIAAYRLEKERSAKETDAQNWYMGQYVGSAILSTIGNSAWFRGKHGKKSKYLEKPLMQMLEEKQNEANMSDDEKKRAIEQLFTGLKVMQTNFELSK